MTTLRLLGFSGEIPRLLPRLLNDGFAQDAFNTRLDDGGLTPIRESKRITYLPPDEFPGDLGTIYLHQDEWLAWPGLVHAVPGPVAQDRLYIFGDGAPRMRVNGQEFPLAIERPGTALTATLSGTETSDLVSTRLYVYTLVTEFGEETEPSPVSNSIDWMPGMDVTLSGFLDTVPGKDITHQRIYRSASGTSGGADFYLIDERPASTADYQDTISPEDFQERLPSRTWNPPPAGLKGGISLPNGMMAAFEGKDLYFCEPWRPHAWPESYVLTTDFPIVGLGAYGNTVVIMTEGNPYVASGTLPESMVMEKLELNLPCINPRGICDLGYTVVYPSHEGLVTVSGGSAQVTTTMLMSRDEWQSMSPKTMVAGNFNGRYHSSYRYFDSFREEHAGTLIFDFTGEQPFIIRNGESPAAYFYDILSGKLYFLKDRDVYEYDAISEVNTMQYWKSKEFVIPKPTNFGAILIETGGLTEEELAALEAHKQQVIEWNEAVFQQPSILGDINSTPINAYAINDDALKKVPGVNQTISVQVYADGKLVATVTTYNRMARLPSGFLARSWEISVSGDMPVTQITLATTGAELMAV